MAKKGINIYKRKDGRWEGRYRNGCTPEGKTKYSSIYGKSYTAVREQLETKLAEIHKGVISKCRATVGEIVDMWLADVKNRVKESTYANYTMKINKHILPCFSQVKYDKLTADELNGFISRKFDEGLSAKYISDIVVLLKAAAGFARKRYGYADRIECVALPKKTEASKNRLLSDREQAQLKDVLTANIDSSNAGILLSAVTGIRIGELCALKWENIDLEKSIITVSRTVQRVMKSGGGTRLIVTSPKSASSVREIPLPEFILPYLKKIKADNDCFLLSGGHKLIEPRTMQYRFKSLLKKAGLPYVNFHALRHMFATSCIAMGFDVKTLSEILGHSSVQITLNRYVHSSMERKMSCMKLLSDSFAA